MSLTLVKKSLKFKVRCCRDSPPLPPGAKGAWVKESYILCLYRATYSLFSFELHDLKGGVPKFFLLHHSTHFWVPIMKIYFFLGVNMDFLFLFDCDCLRHKEGIRCTLVSADSCDSRNGKMPYIKYISPRLYKRCMTYSSQQYGGGFVLTKPLP